MPLTSRVFKLAKDPEHPEQNEDACGWNSARGIGVVADGVSSAIFSRQWASILTEAVLNDPPNPQDAKAFAAWLTRHRKTWSERIDVNSLAWHQKAKLPHGAFSTLLWVRVVQPEVPREGEFGAFRLQCFAIGDSCLMHVRHGKVLRMFPITESKQLEADPVVLGSVDLGRDNLMQFETFETTCYPDDTLLLCTDAIAHWALRRMEAGDPPAWDDYWQQTDQQWQAEVAGLRDQRQMPYDDATLLLLRVTTEPQPDLGHRELPAQDDDEWAEKFKAAGEQFAEGVELASEQLMRGLKKWKGKALEKYRETFKPDDR